MSMQPPSRHRPVLLAQVGGEWIRGSERCLLDLAGGLAERGYRPVVWANAQTLVEAARAQGFEALHFEAPGDIGGGPFLPPRALLAQGRAVMARVRPVLVHCNMIQTIKWLLPPARQARVPVMAHLHLPTSAHERNWAWLHQVNLVVGVSRYTVEGLLADGMPPERVQVIYNAVDARRFAGPGLSWPASARSTDGLLRVVAMGSLIHRKGYDILLRAFAQAQRQLPQLRLRLAGAGPEDAALRALAEQLGLAKLVDFAGEVRDLGAFYAAGADIFVTASRLEAFNLALVEAGFVGVPPIVSDIPPHREVLGDVDLAPVVPVERVDALAAAILRLAGAAALREQIGERFMQRVRQEFSLERYQVEHAEACDRLLARPAASHAWLGSWHWPRSYGRWIAASLQKRVGLRRRHAEMSCGSFSEAR